MVFISLQVLYEHKNEMAEHVEKISVTGVGQGHKTAHKSLALLSGRVPSLS